ncbi:MAG: cytochrome c-type biogenesis protein CcmH [Anaerolineae bacterium]|jgi:cytochrome c-type biogenesis protein CcmH|nr:cytochrome c-type biogenesis protein CcmH [Anaerolineae bacterium]
MIRLIALMLFLSLSAVIGAQEGGSPLPAPIDYDEVNEVAKGMFCPDCENVPLDKCLTQVCLIWKQEIADQLAAGRTRDEIHADFRMRFGEQVIAIPQDPSLRALSLVAPWILASVVILIGVWTFWRWTRSRPVEESASTIAPASSDHYRQQLEQDLHNP